MKVLQIYKDYYPPVKGGIEKHINLLAKGLVARGIQVEVLVSSTGLKMEIEDCQGIRVYKAPQIGRISSAPLNPTLPFWIRKLGGKADILHFHFPNPSTELAYLVSGLRKKFVVTYHSDIIRQVYLKLLYEPFMHQFLRHARKIIVTSPNYSNTSKVLRRYKDKCEIIPLGIDVKMFNGNGNHREKTARLRRRHGTPIILFVGKFRYYKGVHVLTRAMRKIDAKLLMIGPELDSSQMLHQISQCHLENKVEVLGELCDETLADYLHASDLLVLPSIKRSEAFGLVQLEAMACGKPVVCTELGTGTSYVNSHGHTGLVVPPNNSDLLAQAVNQLLNSPSLSKFYGENSLARVKENFSSDKMVTETERLYNRIFSSSVW